MGLNRIDVSLVKEWRFYCQEKRTVLCMYVCTYYVCMYVCTYVRMYICMLTWMYVGYSSQQGDMNKIGTSGDLILVTPSLLTLLCAMPQPWLDDLYPVDSPLIFHRKPLNHQRFCCCEYHIDITHAEYPQIMVS